MRKKRGYRCWRQRLTGRYKHWSPTRAKALPICESWRIPYADSLSSLAASCDAVFVHSSTASHFDVVSSLLNAGVHVCVDKPLAENLRDAERLVRGFGGAEKTDVDGRF
ncbi:Gfo/Idh/MocA family oxidoreductase [Escherichia coli]